MKKITPKKLELIAKKAFWSAILKPLREFEIEYWGLTKTSEGSIRTPDGNVIPFPRLIASEYTFNSKILSKYAKPQQGKIATIEIKRDGDFMNEGRKTGKFLIQTLHIVLLRDNTDIDIELTYEDSQYPYAQGKVDVRPVDTAKYRMSIWRDSDHHPEQMSIWRDSDHPPEQLDPSYMNAPMHKTLFRIKDTLATMYFYVQDKDAWLVGRYDKYFGKGQTKRPWSERYQLPWNKQYQHENPIIKAAKSNLLKKYDDYYIEQTGLRY